MWNLSESTLRILASTLFNGNVGSLWVFFSNNIDFSKEGALEAAGALAAGMLAGELVRKGITSTSDYFLLCAREQYSDDTVEAWMFKQGTLPVLSTIGAVLTTEFAKGADTETALKNAMVSVPIGGFATILEGCFGTCASFAAHGLWSACKQGVEKCLGFGRAETPADPGNSQQGSRDVTTNDTLSDQSGRGGPDGGDVVVEIDQPGLASTTDRSSYMRSKGKESEVTNGGFGPGNKQSEEEYRLSTNPHTMHVGNGVGQNGSSEEEDRQPSPGSAG